MKVYRNLTAMAVMAAALTIAAQAHANSVIFFLTTLEGPTTTTPTNGVGMPAPNPQVEVIVSTWTDSTHTTLATGSSMFATVEFERSSGTFSAPVGINVNTSIPFDVTGVVGSLTAGADPCGFGLTACTGGGTSHAGSFNVETSANNSGTITIDLAAANSKTWADASLVLAPNSDGWEAADNMAGSPQGLGVVTPIPAALPLFATGIGAIGLLGWRRKRKAQSA
jgi:hypothetical protein